MKRPQREHLAKPLGEFVDREKIPHSPRMFGPMYYYDPQDPHIVGSHFPGYSRGGPTNLAHPEGWLRAVGFSVIIGVGSLAIALGSHNWIIFIAPFAMLCNLLYLAYLRYHVFKKEPRLIRAIKRVWRTIKHSWSASEAKEHRVYKREGFRRRTVASKSVLLRLSTHDQHQQKKPKQDEK